MMKLKTLLSASLITIAAFASASPARADSQRAYCTYIPHGATQPEAEMPCQFYQAQGHIVLTWQDGIKSDFMPFKDVAMTYQDQNGGMVYRDATTPGVNIFKMENGTIYVTPER